VSNLRRVYYWEVGKSLVKDATGFWVDSINSLGQQGLWEEWFPELTERSVQRGLLEGTGPAFKEHSQLAAASLPPRMKLGVNSPTSLTLAKFQRGQKARGPCSCPGHSVTWGRMELKDK
jgi:hypothetical protein